MQTNKYYIIARPAGGNQNTRPAGATGAQLSWSVGDAGRYVVVHMSGINDPACSRPNLSNLSVNVVKVSYILILLI